MSRWWKENQAEVAEAVDTAEKTSGHQILVRVGSLGRHPDRIANKIALKYPAASLVFCVDPRRRAFEVRWTQAVNLDASQATAAVQAPLREHNLPAAITALAALLPHQEEGEELPDIIDDREN
jgi:hypothetical protein